MIRKHLIAAAVSGTLLGSATLVAYADNAPALESDEQKYSYSLGYVLGKQLDQQFSRGQADFDREVMVRALGDVLLGKEAAMNDEEVEAVMKAEQEKAMAEAQQVADAAMAKSQAFLDENKGKEGVSVTASGLQYKVLTEGSGAMPKAEDTVLVNYKGTLLDGTEFDSSYKRGEPAEFPLQGIIPGWSEALQLMKEGSKWEVVIPPELAYGERGAGGRIGPNEVLIFEIELLEIKK